MTVLFFQVWRRKWQWRSILHRWKGIQVEPVSNVCPCSVLRKCVFMVWSCKITSTLIGVHKRAVFSRLEELFTAANGYLVFIQWHCWCHHCKFHNPEPHLPDYTIALSNMFVYAAVYTFTVLWHVHLMNNLLIVVLYIACWVCQWKNFEILSIFDKDIDISGLDNDIGTIDIVSAIFPSSSGRKCHPTRQKDSWISWH